MNVRTPWLVMRRLCPVAIVGVGLLLFSVSPGMAIHIPFKKRADKKKQPTPVPARMMVEVPPVTNITQAEAKKRLKTAGLGVKAEVRRGGTGTGLVVFQKPAPKKMIRKGSVVTIWVSPPSAATPARTGTLVVTGPDDKDLCIYVQSKEDSKPKVNSQEDLRQGSVRFTLDPGPYQVLGHYTPRGGATASTEWELVTIKAGQKLTWTIALENDGRPHLKR